ncbi:hypothetical protein [Clostridium sp.]|uniref:hypothetical protein n=1 Tax=Clostridium sp. TaxID=1506 RepID=UPI002FC7906E
MGNPVRVFSFLDVSLFIMIIFLVMVMAMIIYRSTKVSGFYINSTSVLCFALVVSMSISMGYTIDEYNTTINRQTTYLVLATGALCVLNPIVYKIRKIVG